MKKNLKTQFLTRQYMLSRDYELYYYSDSHMANVDSHAHDYYEFYFFLEGTVSYLIEEQLYSLKAGDVVVIPPGIIIKQLFMTQRSPTAVLSFGSAWTIMRESVRCPKNIFILSVLPGRNRNMFFIMMQWTSAVSSPESFI